MKKFLVNKAQTNNKQTITNLDGWQDVKRGLNTFKDKRFTASLNATTIDQKSADLLYRSDDIAKKVVDDLVDDSLREGFLYVLKSKKR